MVNKKKIGAFYIKHKSTGKLLLGVSSDIKSTIDKHLNSLRNSEHKNKELQTLYNSNSDLVIKTYCTDNLEEANGIVSSMAKHMRDNATLLNYKHDYSKPRNEETVEKIRIANTGRKQSQETKDKISAANKGRLISEDTRSKLRIASADRISSPEVIVKMQEARRNSPTYSEQLKRIADIGKARSLKVNADGKVFSSIKDTATYFNISPQAVRRRLDSKTEQFRNWSYL